MFSSEPEFRLVFMSGATVFMGLGMFLFGYTMAIGANAILCAFLQGVMMVGVLIGIFATLAYGLDAFRSQSSEIFIMNMLFKVIFFLIANAIASQLTACRTSCFTAFQILPTLGWSLTARNR
jgi:hypothetical protein